MSSELPPERTDEPQQPVAAEIVSPDAPDEDPNSTEEIGAEEMGRLHPLSLIFDSISHIRSFIIPAIIGVFSAANGRIDGLIFAGIIFVPTVIQSTVRYFSLRYQIKEAELVVTQGIFFRRIRTVPIEKIQNIDLVQNVLHRIFRVAEVRIETASGTEPEATLRVLAMSKVDQLRAGVFRPRAQVATSAQSTLEGAVNSKPDIDSTVLHEISISQLLRAGLASNRGLLMLGVLLGLFTQMDEQIAQVIDLKKTVRSTFQGQDFYHVLLISIGAFVGLMLLFRLLGTAWYILRFYGYQLTRTGEDLRIQCGLLTKVSATVPRKRIQFISIQQNLLMRWMKLASIRIETAGAAGKGKEDATKTVSSRWFLPVLPQQRIKELIAELRPGLAWELDSFDWQPISPKAGRRMMRLAIATCVVLAIAGYFVFGLWGIVVGVVALPPSIWLAHKRSQSRKFATTDEIIAFRSGIFTTKTSMAFYEKIQTVSVYQSPFDRRWDMATLCIDTAAAGPANHKIRIKYLTDQTARAKFESIVQSASGQSPVFG